MFLPPLVASLPFVYLNSAGVISISNTPIPYAAYAMVGAIIWQTFVDALNSPLRSVNAARAMLTMGLTRLVLVRPRRFPDPEAAALASGATVVLDGAEVVATLD